MNLPQELTALFSDSSDSRRHAKRRSAFTSLMHGYGHTDYATTRVMNYTVDFSRSLPARSIAILRQEKSYFGFESKMTTDTLLGYS